MNSDSNSIVGSLFAILQYSGNKKLTRENWAFILHQSNMTISSNLKMAEEGINVRKRALTALEWLEAFGEHFTYDAYECDEEGFEMRCLCEDCAKAIRLVVKHKDISVELKSEFLNRIKNLSKFSVYKEGMLDIEDLCQHVSVSMVSPEEKLKSLNELIAKERRKGWNNYNSKLSDLAIERYHLLWELGRRDEAEKAIIEDAAEVKVCEFIANKYLEDANYVGALGILTMGIDRIWESLDSYCKLKLWNKKLGIYARLNDRDGMINSYRELFNLSFPPKDLEYFHKLKEIVPEKEWTSLYYDLMRSKYFIPSFMEYNDYGDSKSEILIEENRLDDLGDYLANLGSMDILRGCEKYGDKVPANKLDQLLRNCADELRRAAQPTTGSTVYENIAHYIQVLQRFPGGKEIAADLLKEFTYTYSGRPAMMRELRVIKP